MKSAIKLLSILLLFFVGLYFFVQQYEDSSRKVERLPWMINAKSHDDTHVFGVHIGKNTLSEMSHVFGKLPELAVFQNKTGQRRLEAYFSRVTIDLLQASIVAVLDSEQVDLSTFADFEKTGKPMPSGLRKYGLSLAGLKASSKLKVWMLAYMPTADYSEQQLQAFFGEPKQKTVLSEDQAHWHYPDKAVFITYDRDGKEIFYYTTKEHYKRLMTKLLAMDGDK